MNVSMNEILQVMQRENKVIMTIFSVLVLSIENLSHNPCISDSSVNTQASLPGISSQASATPA